MLDLRLFYTQRLSSTFGKNKKSNITMTQESKIIASSIIVGAATIGVSITSLGLHDDNIEFPIIVGIIGIVMLVQAWTGSSAISHVKAFFGWANDYDKLENRMIDPEEGEDKK
ncbi:hypothetical protein JIN77_16705 [Verrucomicrobiaceae bacterium R5-34]|nr:hypothetical protein [Verrucomicrobiaceae bacterium R5-34]